MVVPMVESEPRVLERAEHPISRRNISPNALKVLNRLQQGGYRAYLVGGSVRDLMLGLVPKDFDIGTDAQPQQVKRLFRNSRIIGRRFRLVHVFFHDEVVEVSTFRREPDPRHQDGTEELLVTSDNTFGTPREDAFRRDFTINALFYDIAGFSVIDYVCGLDDLERRVVRVIGDPDLRFQEDPVRMMRACEFAGRLGFTIDRATQESIDRQRRKIDLASPVRVTEEVLQLLRCGSAGASLQWMLELGLLESLLPEALVMVGRRSGSEFGRILPTLDRLVRDGRAPSEASLLAVLLLPQTMQRRDELEEAARRPMTRAEVRRLVDDVVGPFAARFVLSKNRVLQLTHALVAFYRLCEPGWRPAARIQMARRPYFDDALGLFELMVETTGEGGEELARWQAAAARRGEVVEEPPGAGARRRTGRRRSRPRRRR